MKIRIITFGKIKKSPHQEIAADYIERISHYLPFELVSVKKEEEFFKKISPEDFLITCDERGQEMISQQFAEFIEERQVRSTRYLTFVIGGAEGLSERAKAKADMNLTFSRFTLQHDFALILLLEQIYRACTIIRGEPYHK